jgi:nucleotide-binding universal stress UspA family protein
MAGTAGPGVSILRRRWRLPTRGMFRRGEAAGDSGTAQRQRLDAAGIPYQERIEFGNNGRSIVETARKEGCAQIIMGTQGRGALADLLLGSVATNVLRLTGVPVTLVK